MLNKGLSFFNSNLGILSGLLIIPLIILMPHEIIWDEAWYINCVNVIITHGISVKFLQENPAAPVHTLIYYFISRFGLLTTNRIRYANLVMCIGICYFAYKTIQYYGAAIKPKFKYALTLFAIPGFYVIGFFAITEGPCLLFYTMSVFLLFKALSTNKNSIGLSILSGLCLGLAIMTRQLFLLCIAPPLLLVFYKQFENRYKVLISMIIATLAVCLPVFIIWGGIVPKNSVVHHVGASLFTPKHLFLSAGYGFFYFAFLIPAYIFDFYKERKKTFLVLVVLGLLSMLLIKNANFVPMSGLLPRLIAPNILYIIACIFFTFTCIFSYLLAYFLLIELFKNKNNYFQVFIILSIAITVFSPSMIPAQFSSRYPMQIAPLLLIFCYSRMKPINIKLQTLLSCLVIAINYISVVTLFM
jgi:4-amino-4-deoxy-L-arabinose transferase-like glycosyltransferase